MDELGADLRSAFEAAGYPVGSVTRNRNRIRIEVLDADASGRDLRELTDEAVGDGNVLGLDVTTEATQDEERVVTIVSFRYRG